MCGQTEEAQDGSKGETKGGRRRKRMTRPGRRESGVERAIDLSCSLGVSPVASHEKGEGHSCTHSHYSTYSHSPCIYRSVVNIASGAVLGLFSGFVLARTSFFVILPSSPSSLPLPLSFLPPSRSLSSTNSPSLSSNLIPSVPFHPSTETNTGTGHGRSLVAAMGVGCGVGASWVRCATDFEEEKKK